MKFKTGLTLMCLGGMVVGAQTQSRSGVMAATIPAQATIGAVGAFAFGGISVQAVTGHPYSAEQQTEQVQTLADGTHITQATQKTLIYRDAEGRTRTEHIFTPPPGMKMVSEPAFVTIIDPVAGYHYMLDERNHVARRMTWQVRRRQQANSSGWWVSGNNAIISSPALPRTLPPNTANAVSDQPHPETTQESLGTQTIEGLAAEGKRTTTVFPEGFMGNDRPITTVTETWTSPDLGTVLLMKTSDPRSGETTTKLTNISLADPDPALFEVPAGYSVVDEQQNNANGISFHR
jgi:hypothetical protein